MAANSSDSDIENLIFIIANLPDFLRMSLCRKKTKELVAMSESEKKAAITRSLNCLNLIDENKLVELTKTWMKAISEVEPHQLTKILHCYLLILPNVKFFNKINPTMILKTYLSLDSSERDKLAVCLKEALFLHPRRDQVLTNIPGNIAKVILD